jgi:predicted GNAT family acetyltransferase
MNSPKPNNCSKKRYEGTHAACAHCGKNWEGINQNREAGRSRHGVLPATGRRKRLDCPGLELLPKPRYFTVRSDTKDKLDIIGVYDTEFEKNVSHTLVNPKYRGQGLAGEFKPKLMAELGLPFLTLTIDLNNTASIRAARKILGIRKVSDEA